MKSKLSILLVALMCCSGCGGNGTSTSSTNQTNNSTSSTMSSDVNSSNSTNVPTSSSSVNSGGAKEKIAVYDLESKSSFVNREQYKGEQTNKEEEFMDREQSYKVGDENGFSFKPQLTLAVLPAGSTDINDVEFRYNADWSYNIKLFMLNDDNEYVDASLDEYVDSLDNNNCIIDFSDSAIGHTFKISLYPEGLNETQMSQVSTKWTKEYEVEVVEGYNVTSAKELAYINNNPTMADEYINMPDIGSSEQFKGRLYKEVWDEFKTENNLKLDYYPSAIILHNDISITKDDIPSAYFYSEEEAESFFPKDNPYYKQLLGSLKDWINVYYRELSTNDEFIIEGNYFSINASTLPIVLKGNTSDEISAFFVSHSTLFNIHGVKTDDTTKAGMQNVKLIGNAPRKDDETLTGGIILTKVQGPEYLAYNNIANRWFITYFPEGGDNPFDMEKCRAYNNFNSFIYNWGSTAVTIKECEFKRAGGPVIIQDCIDDDDTDPSNDIRSKIKIEDSVLESIVSGSEGWFQIMAADTKANDIRAIDPVFRNNSKTFLQDKNKNQYFNLISVNKSGSAEGISVNFNTKGTIAINNDTTNYVFNYGEEGATNPLFGIAYNAITNMSKEAPIFETSAGGVAFFNGTNIITFDQTMNQIIAPADNSVFAGDYIAIYTGGMQLVLDYYNYEKPAE